MWDFFILSYIALKFELIQSIYVHDTAYLKVFTNNMSINPFPTLVQLLIYETPPNIHMLIIKGVLDCSKPPNSLSVSKSNNIFFKSIHFFWGLLYIFVNNFGSIGARVVLLTKKLYRIKFPIQWHWNIHIFVKTCAGCD